MTVSSTCNPQNRFIYHRSFPADHREPCRGSRLKVLCLCSLPQSPRQHGCSWLAFSCQLLASELLRKRQGGRKAPHRGRAGGKNGNGEWLHSPHSCPKPPRPSPPKYPREGNSWEVSRLEGMNLGRGVIVQVRAKTL